MKNIKKKILIIGGTNGLGYFLSKKFIEKNYEVFSVGRKLILPKITNVKYIFINLEIEKKYKIFIEKIKKIKNINSIIYCIGGSLGLKELDYLTCLKLWNLNVGIPIRINHDLIKNKNISNSTRVIFISSRSTLKSGNNYPYIMAKKYLENYCKLLNEKFKKKMLIAYCLRLGIVATSNNNWAKCKSKNIKKYKKYIKQNNLNGIEICTNMIFKKISNIIKRKKFLKNIINF